MTYRIGIIGGGNMGGAIIRGSLAAGVLQPSEVIVAEVDADKRRRHADLGCHAVDDVTLVTQADQIMLAVKPQVFSDIAKRLSPLPPDKIIISIMAGLNSRTIRSALGDSGRIVRAMPNVPCQIGMGVTAIALGAGAQPGDDALATSIFKSLGATITVDESHMYAVTAVSGSGPAYVFLLAEAMERAAIEVGLDAQTARTLVQHTIMGAGRLLAESDQSAEQLRQSVTSPGGTTAAALDIFTRRGFTEMVVEAIAAARDRGKALDQA